MASKDEVSEEFFKGKLAMAEEFKKSHGEYAAFTGLFSVALFAISALGAEGSDWGSNFRYGALLFSALSAIETLHWVESKSVVDNLRQKLQSINPSKNNLR